MSKPQPKRIYYSGRFALYDLGKRTLHLAYEPYGELPLDGLPYCSSSLTFSRKLDTAQGEAETIMSFFGPEDLVCLPFIPQEVLDLISRRLF